MQFELLVHFRKFKFVLVSCKTQNHPLVSWSSSSSSSLVSTCPRPGWTNIGGERLLSTKLSCMEREFRKDIFSSFSEKPGLSPPPRKQDDGAWNLSRSSGCRDWRCRDCCSSFSISFTENGVDVAGLGSIIRRCWITSTMLYSWFNRQLREAKPPVEQLFR